jgi:cellulose synthase operon protein C
VGYKRGGDKRAAGSPVPVDSPEAPEGIPPQKEESRHPEEIPEPSKAERQRGRSWIVLVSLVIVAALLMLGFSPLSRLAARGLPRAPGGPAPVVTGPQRANTSAVQAVPAGLPDGARIRTAADVFPYAVAALGERGARKLMALLNAEPYVGLSLVGYGGISIPYPYDYPPLDTVLDSAPPSSFSSGANAATALGAALTVLAAQPEPGPSIVNASAIAYGVLNRVRVAGGCAPQLDLMLLLAADQGTSPGALSQEERRTEAACPRDPTPAWLAGQSELRVLQVGDSADYADPEVVAHLRGAVAAFSHLAAEYPRDTGALTGLGDAYLRTATYLRSSEPFTARRDFRLAITEYNRASALGDERDATPGAARALIGLGAPATAARLLAPLATSSAGPGQLLELLITADEAARDFGQAVTVARRLDRLGSAAYPNGDALLPVPQSGSVDILDDNSLPLSFGVGRMARLTSQLIIGGGAGATLQDLSFIPQYRDDHGVAETQPSCPSWTEARDEILLGHPALALARWPAHFTDVRSGEDYCGYGTGFTDMLKPLAETLAGQQPDQALMKNDSITSDDIADAWQDLLRWAGDLPAAKKAAGRWQAARGDSSALPALRLGEIDFLMHDYNDAAAEFGLTARRFSLAGGGGALQFSQAELDRGAALLAAGRAAEAVQTLRPLDLRGTQGYAFENSPSQDDSYTALEFAAVSFYACEQLGDYESQSGNLRAAVEDYTSALGWVPQMNVDSVSGVRPEVLDNNAALAYLGLGDTITAAALENKALAADPEDPVFLMTAGFIADRAGRTAQAARYDREALDSDPGAFPAANDLGVELTREHQDGVAEAALRQAVSASPGYALGWFNLGVAESRLGPSGLLASQGAFARAYALEPALRDRRHEMTIDASVYRTALDLSKPLPPGWSISQLQRPAPAAAAGLLALVMLAFGLARATGHGGGTLAAQWIDPLSDRLRSAPVLRRLHHPAWAMAATAASFLFAYLRRGAGPTEVVAYTAGVAVLAFLAVAARMAVARRQSLTITHETWPPALAFGLVAGAIGLPWAPLPVVRTDSEDSKKVHLAAPITLAALSVLLFVESAWLHTPVTQSWAVAALIMSASTLLPVGPLDGAQAGKAGALAATGLVGGALVVGLGLI